MSEKNKNINLSLDPNINSVKNGNITVWSHDKNSSKIMFDIDDGCGGPLVLVDAKPRILLILGKDIIQVFDLTIVSERLGQAYFIIPDRILGYEGRVKASVYVDYEDKTHDLGSFYFDMKKSDVDGEFEGVSLYIESVETALKKAEELNEQIKDRDLVTRTELAEVEKKKANKESVNKLEQEVSTKATKQETDNKLEKKTNNETFVAIIADMQRQIESTQSGMIGDFNSVEELKKAYPKGEKGFATVEINGEIHRFIWDGSKWEDRGLFNAMGIADESIDAQKVKNYSLGNIKFSNESMNRRVLTEDFSYLGNFERIELKNMVKEGYTLCSHSIDAPEGFVNSGIVEIKNSNGWIHQTFSELQNPSKKAFRLVRNGVVVKDWETQDSDFKLNDNSIERNFLKDNFLFNATKTSGSVDNFLKDGNYLLASNQLSDLPEGFSGSAILEVTTSGGWTHQTISELQNPSKKAFRYLRGSNKGVWEIDASKYPLTGKKIVNFGDSTIGNIQGGDSVSGFISKKTGAKTYNVGFGGCRMGKHDQYWDAFSFYRLMSEVSKDDSDQTKWAYQNRSIEASKNGEWKTMPGYFPKHLEDLKSIDFNEIDIVTISYGTNDYTGGNPVDNSENELDVATFGGALRFGLSKFMSKFIKVNVLVCTQTYRIWFNEDKTFKEDSDTTDFAGTGTLIPYVNKTIEISKEFKTPCLDTYFEMGVNKFNYSKALTYPDGVHHDKNGRKLFGEMIARKIEFIL